MIDIKPFIGELISGIAKTELAFNDSFMTPPLAVITEIGNRTEITIGNNERVSRVSVQLDIYAHTPAELEELSGRVNAIIIGRGLRRSFSEVIYGEKYPRRCMRYDCGIDEVSGRILVL